MSEVGCGLGWLISLRADSDSPAAATRGALSGQESGDSRAHPARAGSDRTPGRPIRPSGRPGRPGYWPGLPSLIRVAAARQRILPTRSLRNAQLRPPAFLFTRTREARVHPPKPRPHPHDDSERTRRPRARRRSEAPGAKMSEVGCGLGWLIILRADSDSAARGALSALARECGE